MRQLAAMNTSRQPLVVLGAGPAGLAAARRAALNGHQVVLVEKSSEVGGMAASHVVAGQKVDLGSHRLHSATDPELLADLQDLLGDELQVRPRNGRIRLNGRWVAFPLRTFNLLSHVGPKFAIGATFDAITSLLRHPRAETFSAYLRAGLGPTVSKAFYEPYAMKLWGLPADELDASLARRRVSTGSPIAIFRKLLHSARPQGRTFLYPRDGYGRICEGLAESACEAGVKLQLSAEVTRIRLENDAALITIDGSELRTYQLLSTIPVSGLARLISPQPPGTVLSAIERLEHRAMVLVYLICNQAQYTPFDAHYLPSADTPISRLSEPKNYREGPDPKDRTVLCCEVPCQVGDEIWKASDEDLGAQLTDSLVQQGLPRPLLARVETRRLPNVYPIYRVGCVEDLSTIANWCASLDRLVVLGRQGLYTPDNLHHVLQMGNAAADAIRSDGSLDRQAWDVAIKEFASFVVED